MKKLDQMTPEELGILFPIILSEPDRRWANRYGKEREKIVRAVGSVHIARIDHIGSTAIPGLISKPTIDILLQIATNLNLDHFVASLTGIGYHLIRKPENPPPHLMFVKGYTLHGFKGQAYHIHARYPGDWDEIHFRDYLRQRREVAEEYGKLKIRLMEKFRNDRDAYTNGKSDFIKKILTEMKG